MAKVSASISIPFFIHSAGNSLNCDTPLKALGTVSTGARIADARFYIHNLHLITKSGAAIAVTLDENDLQTDNIALLDFRDKLGSGADACQGAANTAKHTQVTGTALIDGEVISGIQFTVGLPASHNHRDPASAKGPLRSPGLASGMTWSWNVGYKFMAIDLFPDVAMTRAADPAWTSNRWNIHIGSTGCVGDAISGASVVCANTNRVDIVLDNFGIPNSHVAVDLAALVARNNMGADDGGAAGCMSGVTDPECKEIFASLGLVHTLNTLADPKNLPIQSVFSVSNDK